jgi:hypothetical protein
MAGTYVIACAPRPLYRTQSMGYNLGPLPGIIRKYLYAGMPDAEAAARKYG